jgi:hypothetical protein
MCGAVVLFGCHGVFGLTELTPDCVIEACVAAGGACGDDGTCRLSCTTSPCECPPGNSCQLDVFAEEAIIDCSRAEDCTIRCLGTGSGGYCVDSLIRCGSGDCIVSCIGEDFSCLNLTLLCGAGMCSLTCAGNGSCQEGTSVACGTSSSCEVECRRDACSSISVACEQSDSCTATCDPGGNNTCNGASFLCQQAQACDLDCAGRPDCTM